MSSVPVFAAEEPGVYLYEHCDYGGDFIRIAPDNGVYNSQNQRISYAPSNFGPNYFFNDVASSLRIVGDYQITLYESDRRNQYTPGLSSLFSSDVSNLDDYQLRDCISSAVIEKKNMPGVYVYEHNDKQGRCLRIPTSYYNYPSYPDKFFNLPQYGFDNSISSIAYVKNSGEWGYPFAWIYFGDDINLRGTRYYLSLADNTQTDFVNLSDLNDRAASLWIYPSIEE